MLWIAGCMISAALLWLGPEIGAAARTRSTGLAWSLKACAVALAAGGLWWPGHLVATAEPPSPNSATMALLAWLVALALAILAGLTAGAATKKTFFACSALAVVTVFVTYGHSMVATPGLFRAVLVVGPWAPGLVTLLLAGALVGLHLANLPERKARWLRAGIALAIAAALALAAGATPATLAGARHPAWPEALLMAGMVLMAVVLAGALRTAGSNEHETSRRTNSTPATTVDSLTQLPTRLYFEDRLAAAATK
ncbi:MAG TPA: hypothetical protein VF319_01890, partial [Caldimonas sp.]